MHVKDLADGDSPMQNCHLFYDSIIEFRPGRDYLRRIRLEFEGGELPTPGKDFSISSTPTQKTELPISQN